MLPLSENLFWDVDSARIHPEKHSPWLAKRVLECGDWPEWQIFDHHYGHERLARIVT